MTDKNVSIWKVEEFLIDNLKELPIGNGKFKIKSECSLCKNFLKSLKTIYERRKGSALDKEDNNE